MTVLGSGLLGTPAISGRPDRAWRTALLMVGLNSAHRFPMGSACVCIALATRETALLLAFMLSLAIT
jgi:hypothetical protein